jgi:O-antigen ligase
VELSSQTVTEDPKTNPALLAIGDTGIDNAGIPQVSARKSGRQFSREKLMGRIVLWAIATSMFTLIFAGNPSNNNWRRHPFVSLVDFFLFGLLIFGLLDVIDAMRRGQRLPSGRMARALTALLSALGVAFVFHPSLMGLATLFRTSAIVLIAHHLEQRPKLLRPAVIAAMSFAIFETIVALGQYLSRHALGLQALGEPTVPFIETARDTLVPSGTLFHPYPLVGFCLIASGATALAVSRKLVKPSFGIATIFATGLMVGISTSVAAALAAGLFSVALLLATIVGKRQGHRSAVVGLLLLAFVSGLAISGSAARNGWMAKSERTTKGVESAGNGRVALLRQSKAMIQRWPLAGVGPGRYMQERDANPDIAAVATEPQPVHNVFLLIIVESGLLGVAALVGLLATLLSLMRRNWLSVVIVGSTVVSNLLFDHYMWMFSAGAVQLGLAFGLIGASCSKSPCSNSSITNAAIAGAGNRTKFPLVTDTDSGDIVSPDLALV